MKINQYINCGLLAFGIICFSACSKKDDKSLQDNGKGNTNKADSLRAFAGKKRVMLSWLNSSKAGKAHIQWNNHLLDISIKDHLVADTVKVIIDSLNEGTYIFDVHTYDSSGNSLGIKSVLGKAYGDQYTSTLINRTIKSTSTSADTLNVEWNDNPVKAVGTQIKYSDNQGTVHTVLIPAKSGSVALKNVKYQDSIKSRTLYLPEPMAIDTFYTTYDPVNAPPIYDETGCLYTSYKNLLMAGYQGWFAAQGDESNRGWYHYQASCGFAPGCSSIDFWPDMSEYTKKYISPFKFADGSSAYLYSPYDAESIDLHFKWMKDYGIDGVFMQRFVTEIKDSNPAGKRHFNKVLENALAAAKKYGRAICIMYDLSGCTSADMPLVEKDWNELQSLYSLFDNKVNPTYVRHNKKPLLSIWGVGFNDNRAYSTADVQQLVNNLKGYNNKISIMIGVPYNWRTLNGDTEPSPLLLTLVKSCDIVMPWAVGRYNSTTYAGKSAVLPGDIQWCATNKIDYVPLVFPGYSWGNLSGISADYNVTPRDKGAFLWKQVNGAKTAGAKALYVAMFDEIDEGTAIYKCAREGELPLNGTKKFVGIEKDLPSDYYLWLTGQAGRWFHGESGFGSSQPIRN